jgi:hypothetical protein
MVLQIRCVGANRRTAKKTELPVITDKQRALYRWRQRSLIMTSLPGIFIAQYGVRCKISVFLLQSPRRSTCRAAPVPIFFWFEGVFFLRSALHTTNPEVIVFALTTDYLFLFFFFL